MVRQALRGLCRYGLIHISGERTRPDITSIAVDADVIAELWYDGLDAMAGRITMFTAEEQTVIPREG